MAIDNQKIFQTKKPGGIPKAKTFAEKFAEERKKQGAGGTFMFKGKVYKLTGLFAPINQLLGIGGLGDKQHIYIKNRDNYERRKIKKRKLGMSLDK